MLSYLFNLTAADWTMIFTGLIGGYLSASAPTRDTTSEVKKQMALGQLLFAAHLALLGAQSGAIVAGVTAVRCGIQSNLDDQNWKAKISLAVIGFTLAAGIYGETHGFDRLWDWKNLPFLTMAMAGTAEILNTNRIRSQRQLYLSSAMSQCLYSVFESKSLFGFAVNAWSILDTQSKMSCDRSASYLLTKRLKDALLPKP